MAKVKKSNQPVVKQAPKWVRYKSKELEMLIVKLSKEGHSPSMIGITLRDTYGIPNVKAVVSKSISEILAEKKLLGKVPEDLTSLMKRSIQIKKHLEENSHDQTAKRGLTLTDSKIKRLIKYYKATGKLPLDWKYDPKQASLMIE